MIRFKKRTMDYIGVASTVVLVAFSLLLSMMPIWTSDDVAAVEEDVNTNILPTLGISATSDVAIDIQVNSSEASTFGTNYTTLRVMTNSDIGYTLQMVGTGGDNAMGYDQEVPDDVASRIESVTSDTLGSALTNQWGYNFVVTSSSLNGGSPVMTANTEKMASSTFHAIPTMATTIRDTSQVFLDATTKASTDIIQINYGIGVTPQLSAGSYTSSITYTAVANYVPADFYSITYMDEMTHAICANTTTPAAFVNGAVNAEVPETVLIDRRDGQSYVVRKLADGNCWMSQNLAISRESIAAYDPSNTDGTLVASLTDTTADTVTVKMPVSYKTSSAAIAGRWNYSAYGKVFLGVDTDGNKQYIENGYNWNDTSTDSKHNANGLTSGSGELNGGVIKTTGSAVYAIGNYYTWWMASLYAGSTGMNSGDTPCSICPKNWTLPSNGATSGIRDDVITTSMKADAITTGFDSNDTSSYSFMNLSKVYGMAIDENWSDLTGAEQAHADSASRLVSAPLSFPRAGFWKSNSQGIYYRGMDGDYWTATTQSGTYAYHFSSDESRFIPIQTTMRSYGLTVRCVAR